LKKLFFYPSNNLVVAIPIVLVVGFITGLYSNTSFLKDYILLLTFIMIYPTMIGFKLKEAIDLSHMKVLILSLLVNFIMIPLIAYILGTVFLGDNPEMFAGIVMISLFPTSGMTISWTMLSKGNVPAAIKITAISLLLGSFLAPWYLFFMAGKFVKVDILQTFITIAQVVILPLILGNITHKVLLKKYTQEQFNKKVKPYFPVISVWAMLVIVFISISMKSAAIVSRPNILIDALVVLVIFYLINFITSTIIARSTLKQGDGFALLYGTVMRNLSIALGIAVASFGPNTALVVTLAFILQVQGAAWYGKLASKYGWLGEKGNV
jgi:arsenite transporter